MNSAKIQYILGKFGYSMDTWSDLSDISMFHLDQDGRCYTGKDRRLRLNTTTECLEVVHGKEINGVFTSDKGEVSDFTPEEVYAFSLIHGVISSVEHVYGTTFNTKKFLRPTESGYVPVPPTPGMRF